MLRGPRLAGLTVVLGATCVLYFLYKCYKNSLVDSDEGFSEVIHLLFLSYLWAVLLTCLNFLKFWSKQLAHGTLFLHKLNLLCFPIMKIFFGFYVVISVSADYNVQFCYIKQYKLPLLAYSCDMTYAKPIDCAHLNVHSSKSKNVLFKIWRTL